MRKFFNIKIILSVFLFFILTFLYMGQASAETIVCDTTSSSTIPGGLVPYSLNFNCEVPVDATASLEIKWTDSSYNDNRDFLMCGGSELYATGNAGPMMPPYPRTVTSDVTSCLQGYNLATGNRICTANAWNLDCGGFNYGTTEYYASFEYAKLTITSPDKILTNIGNITGTTEVGQTLTAGSLTPSGATVDYQWMRSVTVDGEYADIENATSTSYVLTSDDIGNYIKVKATSNAEYTGIVVSEPTSLVEAVSDPFANYSEEGIDGLSTSTAYTIATCEQLQNISADDGVYLDKYFKLDPVGTTTLDCSETSGWNSYESEGIAYYGFEPIGTEENPFTGYFDGNNKTISNLYINRYGVNYIGLFGYVEPGENEGTGKIENLNLTNVDISGERYIGALVGYLGGTADNHGLIKNSHSSGEVEAFTLGAGGLIGLTGAYGDIEDSNSSVSASSWFKAGGLVGVAQGSIDNCYATGEVNITGYGAGGLVGYLKGGTIRESYATGDVGGGAAGEALDQTSSYAGGLVGLANLGKIYESYATGDVVGSSIRVGGLVGGTNSTIENSYALGDVEGTDRVGGLVGGSTGEIINSYSVGKVTVNGALILNEGDELIANDGGGGGGGYFGGEGGESDGIPGAGGSGFASSSVSNAILTTGNNGDGSERALPPNIDDENYITGVGLGGNYSLNSGNGLVYLNYGSGNITFSYTGESQTFTVPEGVTSINVKVWGAGGGGANYSDEYQGGSGGFAGGTITVNPRDILIIIVGGGGGRGISNTVGGVGGYGGGGYGTRGDAAGAGGGGLSGIFTDENGTDFESLTQGNAIIIAGGGGGGTGYSGPGGAGGGEEGNNGGDDESCGGTQDAGGSCLTSGSDGIALHGGNGDSNGIKGNAVSVFDYAGGLIGYNTGTTTSSYWNTETSEQAESNGGIGKTTAELKNQSTFVGWNFTDIWEMFSGEYPKLLAISADDPDDEDEIVYYTLTYTAGTGGTLTGSTTQSVVSGEDGTAVTAVPNSGYRFVRWSDNSTTNPRTDSNVNESFSISAIFERRSSGGSSIGSVAKPIISTTTPTTNLALSNCQLVDLLLNINVITQDKASPARNVLGCNSDMNTDIINGTTTKYYFPRNLKLGMIGDDVKELQKFLNMQGFPLVQTGEGSAGQETTKYGSLTKQAVIKFQEANFDAILKPLNLTKGTGLFYDSTRNFVNDLLK